MEFVQARNYTKTDGRQIDLIVVHDMETPEDANRAESVAAWFAGPTAPRASAHYQIDNNSIVQSVRDQDVAWHAPGANHNGIGLEHAGRASQSLADWLDPYSLAMLKDQSAPLTKSLCDKYNIPIRFVDAAGLLRGERGITTHWEVSKAFRRSSHTDPGPNFPMVQYLGWVSGSGGQPVPIPEEDMTPEQDAMLKEVHRDLVQRATGPIPITDANGKRLVFVQGIDRGLYVKEIGATQYTNLGGKIFEPITRDQIDVDQKTNTITVAIKGDNEAVWMIERKNDKWSGWSSLGGLVD